MQQNYVLDINSGRVNMNSSLVKECSSWPGQDSLKLNLDHHSSSDSHKHMTRDHGHHGGDEASRSQ